MQFNIKPHVILLNLFIFNSFIVMPIVIVRQRRPWHRLDGTYIYMEDNACVITNPKGEMKGSQITGPVCKEAAELWPKVSSHSDAIV